jgi:hypothetical protein
LGIVAIHNHPEFQFSLSTHLSKQRVSLNNKHKATPPRSTATLPKKEKNKIHTLELKKHTHQVSGGELSRWVSESRVGKKAKNV